MSKEEHIALQRMYLELQEGYFELKQKYSKILEDCHDYRHETHAMKMTIINLMEHFEVNSEEELKNIYLNNAYKFEELKVGMWVWDNAPKRKMYVKISAVGKSSIVLSYPGYESSCINFKHRFYPREVNE